jgi:hypothetical protein
MNTTKFFVGGIIGGILNFFLGWLVWGMLLMNFMKENSNQSANIMRGENDMVWWGMILGNLCLGFLFSYIISRARISTIGGGATAAAVAGFFLSLGYDSLMYAQMDIFNTTAMVVDVLASTVVAAIVGAVIGWYNSRGTVATAAA